MTRANRRNRKLRVRRPDTSAFRKVPWTDRQRIVVGTDSELWAAVQRGLIARHLGGEGRDLGGRLDYPLRGEERTLLPYLTEAQRAGLGRLRGVQQAETARMSVPTWASDLERNGFGPNAVARSIFSGSGALGAKPGAANDAQAAKAFLGADSQEWAGLRQAAVQRLMDRGMPGHLLKMARANAAVEIDRWV